MFSTTDGCDLILSWEDVGEERREKRGGEDARFDGGKMRESNISISKSAFLFGLLLSTTSLQALMPRVTAPRS